MKPRLTIIEPLGDSADIETTAAAMLGVDVDFRPSVGRAAMLEASAGAEAILIRLGMIDADFMDASPDLKVIGRCGVGTDNIDIAAATARGIQVINVPDYCVEEVATHAATLMLAAWRRVPAAEGLGAAGRWWDWSAVAPIRPLSQCTLGIVGIGRMGRTAIEMFGHWFKDVLYFDPMAMNPPEGPVSVTLEELFERSDVISLHCPSLPSTRGMVNTELLDHMKPDALLVNVSRGDLIDEDALLAGLAKGTPSRAALDVLAVEPPAPDHPLLHHPDVLVTNHMAWMSTEAEINVRALLARRCAQALLGMDGETVVNARELQASR